MNRYFIVILDWATAAISASCLVTLSAPLSLAAVPYPTPAGSPTIPGTIAPGAFVCFGPGFMYTTHAPQGWTLDDESGQPDGLCVVGYPSGGSWKNSESVIYTNATPKSAEKGTRNLAEMIVSDLKLHKAGQSGLTVKDGPPLTNHGRKLVSKYFLGEEKAQGFEAVAYVDEPGAVVFLVMTSRTETSFKKAVPAFRAFVEGYQLLASNLVSKPVPAALPTSRKSKPATSRK